jgi:hypothetical protein
VADMGCHHDRMTNNGCGKGHAPLLARHAGCTC